VGRYFYCGVNADIHAYHAVSIASEREREREREREGEGGRDVTVKVMMLGMVKTENVRKKADVVYNMFSDI
jgi:hypothetical protein